MAFRLAAALVVLAAALEIETYDPPRESRRVASEVVVRLTFDAGIALNTDASPARTLTLLTSNAGLSQTFPATDARLSVDDRVLEFRPPALAVGNLYTLVLDGGFVLDAATGAEFAGLSAVVQPYRFTVRDMDPPTLVSAALQRTAAGEDVALRPRLELVFSEPVIPLGGDIRLQRSATADVDARWDVWDAGVVLEGNTVTVEYGADRMPLAPDTAYEVVVSDGAVWDGQNRLAGPVVAAASAAGVAFRTAADTEAPGLLAVAPSGLDATAWELPLEVVWDFNEPVTLSAAARCSATLEGDMPAEAHWPIAPGGAELPYRLAVELAWPPGEVVSSDIWTRSDDGWESWAAARGLPARMPSGTVVRCVLPSVEDASGNTANPGSWDVTISVPAQEAADDSVQAQSQLQAVLPDDAPEPEAPTRRGPGTFQKGVGNPLGSSNAAQDGVVLSIAMVAAGAAALGLAVALRKRAARARAPGARSARELAATYGGEGPKGPGAVRGGWMDSGPRRLPSSSPKHGFDLDISLGEDEEQPRPREEERDEEPGGQELSTLQWLDEVALGRDVQLPDGGGSPSQLAAPAPRSAVAASWGASPPPAPAYTLPRPAGQPLPPPAPCDLPPAPEGRKPRSGARKARGPKRPTRPDVLGELI